MTIICCLPSLQVEIFWHLLAAARIFGWGHRQAWSAAEPAVCTGRRNRLIGSGRRLTRMIHTRSLLLAKGTQSAQSGVRSKAMSIENVTTALQVNPTTGNGLTLTLRDASFLTFKITGNGAVSSGQIAIERNQAENPAGSTPMLASAWSTLVTIPLPRMRQQNGSRVPSLAPFVPAYRRPLPEAP
jgi:hypothetical protein